MNDSKKIDIVFVVIAKRDAPFFAKIADKLNSSGYGVGFISFYEPAYELLSSNSRIVWHPFKDKAENKILEPDIEKEFNLTLNDLVRHEYVTSNVDVNQLRDKACVYLNSIKKFFGLYQVGLVIQEIGGFVGNLSVYNAAKNSSVPHMFIEPSFYKNRAFFFLNSLGPFRVALEAVNDKEAIQEKAAIDYLDIYHNESLVSFSDKDLHHYSSPFTKVLNRRNWNAFLSKILDLYLSKKHVEFGYPVRKVLVQLTFFRNYWQLRLAKRYEKLEDVKKRGKIVYFPLHVPDDFQLTVRSPEFHNQVELINYIASNLPQGYRLATKEHPAMKGSLSPHALKRYIAYDNASIIEPSTNNYLILKECDLVITVNSKSGFEGVLHNKPVITLSDTFYTGYGFTKDVHSLEELRNFLLDLKDCDSNPAIDATQDKITRFLSEMYKSTYWQNLYVNDYENIQRCAQEIERFIKGRDEINCASKN